MTTYGRAMSTSTMGRLTPTLVAAGRSGMARIRMGLPGLLSVTGLGSMAAGAWVAWGLAAGLAASGAALLLTAWTVDDRSGGG